MIRPAVYGESANPSRLSKEIEISVDGPPADSRILFPGELIDLIGGRMIIIPVHETDDQFTLPSVSVSDIFLLHGESISEVFEKVNNETRYQ